MTIYYNPSYSALPYRKTTNDAEFGNIYCGDIQLLQRLLFYAGVPYRPVAKMENNLFSIFFVNSLIESWFDVEIE